MSINTLAFLVTKKCNANCDICCFSCSPQNTETIDFELVHRLILEASSINDIKGIGFSGGEPFIYFDEILSASSIAQKNNLFVTCTTNCFWANNDNETYKKLKKFKENGLSKLGISIDEYHNKYIPIENIKRVLSACRELSIVVDAGSVITKNKNNIYDLIAQLGDEMRGVRHQSIACLPIGNANTRIDKKDLYYNSQIIEDENKCYAMNYFSVMPNGDVYPCCSQACVSQPLLIGNAKSLSITELIKKYNSNMTIRILQKYGLSWYVNIAKENSYNSIFNREYVNICDLCSGILSDQEMMEMSKDSQEDLKRDIYNNYLKRIV